MEDNQEPLDLEIAARTAMLFGLGIERSEACNMLGVLSIQYDSWVDLWEALEEESRTKDQ